MDLQRSFFHTTINTTVSKSRSAIQRNPHQGMSPTWIENLKRITAGILHIRKSGADFLDTVVSGVKAAASCLSFGGIWKFLPFVLKGFRYRGQIARPGDRRMNADEEDRYWAETEKSRMALQQSDARYVGKEVRQERSSSTLPLVTYYTPALPDIEQPKKEAKRYISCKNYCKWHKMVFPGRPHPDLREAHRLQKLHSGPELRMIDHIARMLTDDQVFSQRLHRRNPKYRKIWLAWFRSSERSAGQIRVEESKSQRH